jgi:DNA-binding winged helix-turn-helix (wHTH) protein
MRRSPTLWQTTLLSDVNFKDIAGKQQLTKGNLRRERPTLAKSIKDGLLPLAIWRMGTASARTAGHPPELSALPQRYAPRVVALSLRESFHFDVHAHPGMDAAFEMMCAFRQTRDLDLAALKKPSLGHGDPRKTAGTFGNRFLSRIELRYETSAEFGHLGEGVRFTPLVDYAYNRSFLDLERIRFEIPVGVRSSRRRIGKQVGQRRGISKGDVFAEVRPKRGVKSGWVALVQGNYLCHARWIFVGPVVVLWLSLCERQHCDVECQNAGDQTELRCCSFHCEILLITQDRALATARLACCLSSHNRLMLERQVRSDFCWKARTSQSLTSQSIPKVFSIVKVLKKKVFAAREDRVLGTRNCDRLCYVFWKSPMATTAPVTQTLRFDVFELNVRAGELRKRGVKLRLRGQPLQVLAILVERAGDVVTREELQAQIWPADTFVDFDHSLHNAIARIREVLGDSADKPRYIETLPRRGYRFIAPVEGIGIHALQPAAESEKASVAIVPLRRSKSTAAIALTLTAAIAIGLTLWLMPLALHQTSAAPATNKRRDLRALRNCDVFAFHE